MGRQLNLNFLRNLTISLGTETSRNLFFRIIEELEVFLDIKSLYQNISIEFVDSNTSNINKNILDLGVSRIYTNNKLNIKIDKNYQKFSPIILLREAYLTFLPFYLSQNEAVKIFVNQIVELNLQELEILEEWKDKTSRRFVNYNFLDSQYDRLKEFFELQIKEEEIDTAIEFFFQYIRNNLSIFEKDQEELYDIIFKNFVYKTSKSINNDDIIETIRILIEIFYKQKTYRALIDYKNYFKEYKKNNLINTNLSLRDFIKNLRWIKNFTYIGPSYQVNWRLIGVEVIFCIFKFNPNLSKHQINSFLANLPFFYQSSSSENNFYIKTHGWFVIPKNYQTDLMKFLKNSENIGYISEFILMQKTIHQNFLNLNYFREKFYQKKGIIDISHRAYDSNYEISFKMEYVKPDRKLTLSILDFIILDRVRYYSITGFSFDQRNKALRTLKSDLIYEIISQKKIIKNLKKSVNEIREKRTNLNSFIKFIENNKIFGFFFILEVLKDLKEKIDRLINLIHKKDINSLYDLQEKLKSHKLSKILNQNLNLKDKIVRNIIFRDLFPHYFSKRELFFKKKRKYELFREYLSSCKDLKIYNLDAIIKIIQNKNLIDNIFLTKEKKIENSYQKSLVLDFNKNNLQKKIENYVYNDPPLIKPILTSTISVGTFAKYYLQIVIKKNKDSLKKWDNIKHYFPRVLSHTGKELFSNTVIMIKHIWLHDITSYEKHLLISIFWNCFKNDLISLRRYFFDGFFQPYSRKEFYDFDKKKFFYTQDLFSQYFKYTRTIFGESIEKSEYVKNKKEHLFWIQNVKDINLLIEEIKDRASRENDEFNSSRFEELKSFHKNLVPNLISNKFSDSKEKEFFKQYINHIYFIPNYQKFGYSHYYFYLNPLNLNEIDFKLLFINTFTKVRYPGYIDKSKSLLISYLFPYRVPNLSYINWLTKSKRIINEHCIFYIKKFYQLFHFDFNISPKGWDLNPNRFKSFYENILYDPKYELKPSLIKEYEVGNLRSGKLYSPESKEYSIIKDLYSFKKKDLKSILSLRSKEEIENIQYIIKKELIFPYIEVKNLGLIERISIIVLDIDNELIDQLIKIFSFFNFGFIKEIEGSYYIKGFLDERFFENGLLIQLQLPECDIEAFIQHFNKIFQYLDIENYLILNDLLEGIPLLKNIYGNLEFLEVYNPWKNLEWNEKDKIWMNWKLFDEDFNFIYPNLIMKK